MAIRRVPKFVTARTPQIEIKMPVDHSPCELPEGGVQLRLVKNIALPTEKRHNVRGRR